MELYRCASTHQRKPPPTTKTLITHDAITTSSQNRASSTAGLVTIT